MVSRIRLIVFAVVLLLVATACQPAAPGGADAGPTPITLALGYIPNVQFAPYYVAAERGYFAEEGIDITLETIFESESVPLVGAGELQFAIASAEQVLLARSQGLPVVYVTKWWQDYPIAIAAKTASGIVTPEDLRGRTVGLPGLYGASYIGLRALLNSAGLAESDIQLESIDFTQVPSLAEDRVEAVVVYANNEPVQLKSAGFDINVIRVADYITLASNGLVTNETTIANQPELVRGMARAILRGLADTLADPDAAFEICLIYVDTLSADDAVQRQVLAESVAMWQTDQLGASSPESWLATQSVLLSMGLLSEPVDLAAAYTNDFLPEN